MRGAPRLLSTYLSHVPRERQPALLALYLALPLLLPLWRVALISLGMERRVRPLAAGVLGVVAVVVAVQHVFAASLFYCDGDALTAALVWHGH
jgi:hypothetical protein